MSLLISIVPNANAGSGRHEIYGDDRADLARSLRELITTEGYGASDIGGKFPVYRDGAVVGTLCYNGRFFKADPLLRVA